MKKIHIYDPIIYPRKLFVAKADADILKYFDIPDSAEDLIYNVNHNVCTDAFTCEAVEKKTNKAGVLIVIGDLGKDQSYITDVITHESVHAADAICQHLGIKPSSFTDGNESYAYLVGWIAGRVCESLINFKKKNDKGRKY